MTATQKNDFTKRTQRRGNEAKIYANWRHVEDKVIQNTAHVGCEDLRSANLELEAAVARGKSKYGPIRRRGIERTFRKTNFRYTLLETESPRSARPSSAARQLKVALPQPRSPAPRADPEGQFVYLSNGRDRENNDRDRS